MIQLSDMEYLLPYEFSPTVLFLSLLAISLYSLGGWTGKRDGNQIGVWRSLSFFLGILLIYAVSQTHIDFLSQHMFWVHRVQHLALHHLGPFLVMLAVPHRLMAQAVPLHMRQRYLYPLWKNPVTQGVYRLVQHPVIAPLLFVGLIGLWLIPSVHFDAMLSLELYKLMNWSMALDGFLFWWLMLDPAAGESGGLSYGVRIVILGLIMLPQILIGAYISLSNHVIYDVYSVCGRAWPIKPLFDQQIGGLTTWIPASMMSILGTLVVLRYWFRSSTISPTAGTGSQRD